MWVRAADLPHPGDAGGTRVFWAAVQKGEYRAVDGCGGACGAAGGAGVCPAGGGGGGGAEP